MTGQIIQNQGRKSSTAQGFCVPAGSASSPMSKLGYRLCAPLRWWSRSILRIMGEEICRFPLRILAILRTRSLRDGVPIPLDQKSLDLGSFGVMNSFLLACSEGMQQLRKRHSWIATLEVQIYFQAFAQGAEWSQGNHRPCNEIHIESTLP